MVPDLPPPLPDELEVCVVQASDSYGVPEPLIQSVMYRESSYRVDALVDGGTFRALGLMQINTQWWLDPLGEFGITEQDLLTKPCVNVAVGTWILRRFYLRHGNWHDALAAYNAGHSEKSLRIGSGYAGNVIASWRALNDQEAKRYAAVSQ